MIPRWRPYYSRPQPVGAFVADVRSFDIPETVAAMVRGAPKNCIAISLRPLGGQRMIAAAEREARRKGIRLIWVPTRAALSTYASI